MKYLISIIIPVYNAEKYLIDCLESCINQTYPYLEIIAVNDGSTDTSLNILNNYSSRDNRIKVYDKQNSGLPDTRQFGISASKGDYIFFIDSDDSISLNAIEILLNAALLNASDISIGNMISVSESGKVINKTLNYFTLPDAGNEPLASYLNMTVLPSLCGRLFKSSLFTSFHFPINYTIGEDVIVNTQLAVNNKTLKVTLVDDFIYNYIQHSNSMVNNASIQTSVKRSQYMMRMTELLLSLDNQLKKYYDKFIVVEAFTCIRDCYEVKFDKKIYDYLEQLVLSNSISSLNIPFWRIILVKLYIRNSRLGKLLCLLINIMRKSMR